MKLTKSIVADLDNRIPKKKCIAFVVLLCMTSGVVIYYMFDPLPIGFVLKSDSRDRSEASQTRMPITSNTSTENTITQNSSIDRCSEKYKRRHFMDISPLGRVGNLLFQLYFLLATAEYYCYTPLFGKFMSQLGEIFDLNLPIPTNYTLNVLQWRTFSVATNAYDSKIEQLNTTVSWRFWGYFQSWKYFRHHEQLIRSALTFKPNILRAAYEVFSVNGMNINDINICVHVRRGDFISERNIKLGYASPDKTYIEKSMSYFISKYDEKHINFIFVSDDIKWCKDNFNENNTYFSPFAASDGGPGKDLALMSICNHSIITAGSFGWMGAWLCGGDVVYYDGYPKRGSWVEEQINKTDYYPPHWIGME